MKKNVQVKVCGMTRLPDAELAVQLGADFLGFNFYANSPRAIDLATYRSFVGSGLSPSAKRVYVQVLPDPEKLRAAADEGFDFFQLHFPAGEDSRLVESWAEIVSPEKLWLAPRIAPDETFPETLLAFAETFLIDAFCKDVFGGTGQTADWGRFRLWLEKAPEKRWVLAGGLNPENIVEAIERSGAKMVDVNSGIESAPGKKDNARLREFFREMQKC